jgi:hypothetical protein
MTVARASMGNRARYGYAIGMLLGAALVSFGAVKAYRFLHPSYRELGAIEGGCDLHAGPCSAALPGGARLSFALAPRPIPLVTPLEIEVRTEALPAVAVEVDFSSPEMNMGFNRPALTAEGAGLFRGKTVLPVCVRERMAWRALVLVHTAGETLGVPFGFVTTGARSAP